MLTVELTGQLLMRKTGPEERICPRERERLCGDAEGVRSILRESGQWESKGSWATGGIPLQWACVSLIQAASCHATNVCLCQKTMDLLDCVREAARGWDGALGDRGHNVRGALIKRMTETRQMHRRQCGGTPELAGALVFQLQ